jgi:hypothetical protein
MTNSNPTRGSLQGTVLVACNCDWGCPCNFNARPTSGKCEGGWTWHVDTGTFDGVPLEGLSFSIFVKWPGAIHEGSGVAVILIDERADDRQRHAIATIIKGHNGGPWGILAWTWPTIHGPKFVPFEIELKGISSRVKAGHSVHVELTTIKNPVTGAEVHPGVVLPEGIILKHGDLGASKICRLSDEISFDHSGQYTAVGPFDYTLTSS